MGWTYRVMKREIPNFTNEGGESAFLLEIHEVYDGGGYTEKSIRPSGETIDELRWQLNAMLAALDKPIYEAE